MSSNHQKPWTTSEENILLEEWARKNLTVGEQKTIASRLGRTFETCRTRVTILRHRHNIEMQQRSSPVRSSEAKYLGVHDDPEDCWWL